MENCERCNKAIDPEHVVSVRVSHPEDGPKKTYYCSEGCARTERPSPKRATRKEWGPGVSTSGERPAKRGTKK